MDKNSEKYKQLSKNPKFVRRETRLWYQALAKHNMNVLSHLPVPPMPVKVKINSLYNI